jgi:hypothetical protein
VVFAELVYGAIKAANWRGLEGLLATNYKNNKNNKLRNIGTLGDIKWLQSFGQALFCLFAV